MKFLKSLIWLLKTIVNFDWTEFTIKSVANFIDFIGIYGRHLTRYSIFIILPIVIFTLFKISSVPLEKVENALISISAFECLALFFTSLGAFIYTELKFTKDAPLVLGYIFVGVHILIGLSVFGIYYVEFIK